MRKTIAAFLLLATCAAIHATAQIMPAHLPEDTQILLRVDLKTLNASSIGKLIGENIDKAAQGRLDALKATSGIDLTKDVDQIFLCVTDLANSNGLIIASGRFDTAKLTTLISQASNFQNKALGSRSLLSWQDRGRTSFLCFADPTLVIVANSEPLIADALGRIDGKKTGLPANSSLARLATAKDRFLSLQANDLSLIPPNPFLQTLQQAQAAILHIGQPAGATDLQCALTLKCATAEAASQMSQAALGLQAILAMQAAKNPDLAPLTKSLTIKTEGTLINVGLNLPESVIRDSLAKQRAAGTPPPARPAF